MCILFYPEKNVFVRMSKKGVNKTQNYTRMNLQLRKFKPESITDDRVCVFIGKRNTGKSTLVKDIMYHKKHLPAGIVLSGTEEGNHFYSEFIPDLFVYGDYDRDAIERVMARQRKLVGAGTKNCGAFMLLDDCMYENPRKSVTISSM